MSETRKITLFIDYPGKLKTSTELLLKIKGKIKEVKKKNLELKNYSLLDIGLCRYDGKIKVSLYFSKQEHIEVEEKDTMADI